MLREAGASLVLLSSLICTYKCRYIVRRFSQDVVAPKVREMDENEQMDPSIITGLFEQGVRHYNVFALPSDFS